MELVRDVPAGRFRLQVARRPDGRFAWRILPREAPASEADEQWHGSSATEARALNAAVRAMRRRYG